MTAQAPLRVTFVVPDLEVGGAERHLTTLVARLPKDEFEARVVCLGREGALFPHAAAHVPALALGHRKHQVVRTIWTLAREFRRTRPDLVILRGYSAELIGRVAALLSRTGRSIVWVRNCSEMTPRSRARRISDRLLDPATSAYFGVAHRQVPYLVEELGHPPEKIRIIHNGVPAELYNRREDIEARPGTRAELGAEPGDILIGILAVLRPEKDHGLFLEAARRVLAEAPQARFAVVGDGDLRRGLEEEARRLGIADRVFFAGYRSDVSRILQALDVAVLCSWSECFPNSVLEAMAASRATVCTDVGGVSEMVEDGVTGLLVPPRDERALAAAMLALVQDPQRREAFGAAGRARVTKSFTLEASAREAGRRFLEVAGRGATPPQPINLTMVMDETGVGGVELVTLRMFEAMDRSVIRPHLVCLRQGGSLAEDFRAAGVPVDVLERSGRFDMRTLPRLVRALRSNGADAVLLSHHHRASLVLGRVAARLAGVRVVLLAAHAMDLVPRGERVLPLSTVRTLRGFSALVTLAPSQREYLRQHEGVGVHPWSRTREVVIPNGIARRSPPATTTADRVRARGRLGLPDDAFVVGIVARLSAEKAHEVLLAAFAEFATTHPDSQLVVVGGGSREEELRTLAGDLGIADRVLFAGLRRDAADLFPAFDVACLSSHHEASPIVVIEAMAAGVPVVATDVGAVHDLLTDHGEGVLVPPGDSTAMATALAELADDPHLCARLGAAARDRAEREFSVELSSRAYENLIRELVRR